MSNFKRIDDIRAANFALGHHWFSPDTLRFFSSRIGKTVYGGRFFITSEQYNDNAPRLYSIREAKPNGAIETVGEFQGYATREAAIMAVQGMLAREAREAAAR